MPKRKPKVDLKQLKQQMSQTLAALPQHPVYTVKPRHQGKSAAQNAAVLQQLLNSHQKIIMQRVIQDAFFLATPLQAYLGKAPFSSSTFADTFGDPDDYNDWVAPHVPGHLCESNPFCEECYS